jgi:sugar/nucleoside kinase (ribokinase family)
MQPKPAYDVIGLGAATLDVLTLLPHFPSEEEVLQAAAQRLEGGGPVATALATLGRLGARTALLDCQGDDWAGAQIRQGLATEGVETGFIQIVPGASSTTATVLVTQAEGRRTILFHPAQAAQGDELALAPENLPLELLEGAAFLHLNGRHLSACLAAARAARLKGVRVSFDGGAGRYRPALDELLGMCNLCLAAWDFARQCTGRGDPAAAAEALLERGAQIAGVTDGIRGAWIASRSGERFHQPAYRPPRLVDTTGCGDAYHGAFLFGLLQGWELRRTAAFASAVAALNAQELGGRSGLPGLEQAVRFMEQGEFLTADGRG